ncbi:hypothetical protein GOB93_18525 [Acetobacter musti]|uniref:Major facilitator superfamily (MFS) profile domain-containing protein n=1 Tax=Acetobacter musti TaxID=864732 RepID=A0ABX0JTS6_9PROT|nr:hypothetical protein [Acetobacter musti]NHN86606.1 hypothetical protein [Acetobacter musti]
MNETQGIPRTRWCIGSILAPGVFINYFDRMALSVASPQVQAEYRLTSVQFGQLFSGFFWIYAFVQGPSGRHQNDGKLVPAQRPAENISSSDRL